MRGESVGGSCSNTSIAARSIKLLSNASISAVSSIIPPLATFMICKFCLALLKKDEPTIPRVLGVNGVCELLQSRIFRQFHQQLQFEYLMTSLYLLLNKDRTLKFSYRNSAHV